MFLRRMSLAVLMSHQEAVTHANFLQCVLRAELVGRVLPVQMRAGKRKSLVWELPYLSYAYYVELLSL